MDNVKDEAAGIIYDGNTEEILVYYSTSITEKPQFKIERIRSKDLIDVLLNIQYKLQDISCCILQDCCSLFGDVYDMMELKMENCSMLWK